MLLLATTPASTPRPVEEVMARGKALYARGTDMAAAKEAFVEVLERDPAHQEARLYYALVTWHEKGPEAARTDLEAALRIAPNDPETLYHHGRLVLELGDPEAARHDFERALGVAPDHAPSLYALGKLLRARGDLDGAAALLERHAALVPDGTAHHVLGEIFLQKGDDERAARELLADLDVDPSCHDARLNLAGLYLENGQYADAAEEYRRSLSYHPADPRALSGLGRASLALGDAELAVGALRAAQALAPEDAAIAEALSRARWRLRFQLGWPLAVVPLGLAAGLLTALVLSRRRRRRDVPRTGSE